MRFGLGWRRELGAGILSHLDEIEVIEVLAEELFEASAAERRAFRFLATQVRVTLHGTSLGLASTEPVDERRLAKLARVIDWLEPASWSEHLAFVRGGGIEVGHLAAPPRNARTLAGLVRNVQRATAMAGSVPLLENIATLIDPPLSELSEAEWLAAVLRETPCDLLLDLHNLHANATNFRFDARAVLASLPGGRIGAIHLAGGRFIERGRLLDDHLHAVPEEVYALLSSVPRGDIDVILERDGNYPPIDDLLIEIRRARSAGGAKAA